MADPKEQHTDNQTTENKSEESYATECIQEAYN